MPQWLVSCLIALALLGGAPATTRAQEPAGDVQAVLDLTLNTASKGEIRVLLSGGDVWADVAALRRAGLVSLSGVRRTVGDRAYVRLSSIDPLMQVVVDEAALTLTRHRRRVAVWRDDGAVGREPARRHPLPAGAQCVSELRRELGQRRRTGLEP